jgi:hypothetical protein
VEGQARGGLKRGSPASERGDCSSKKESARGTRSAGVITAATCWVAACERQWPLWHANCRSGVSGPESWSTFITADVASTLVKPKSHPAQCISETSKPSVTNRTNGSRPSRLPVLVPAAVTLTCIISTSERPSSGPFKACLSNNMVTGESTRRRRPADDGAAELATLACHKGTGEPYASGAAPGPGARLASARHFASRQPTMRPTQVWVSGAARPTPPGCGH